MATLRVTSIGFDNQQATFLKTTVDLATGLDIGQWTYVSKEQADVILVDTEHLGIQKAIERYKEGGHQNEPITISCLTDRSAGEAATSAPSVLYKPVTYPALVTLLRRLQTQLTPIGAVVNPVMNTKGLSASDKDTAEHQSTANEPVDNSPGGEPADKQPDRPGIPVVKLMAAPQRANTLAYRNKTPAASLKVVKQQTDNRSTAHTFDEEQLQALEQPAKRFDQSDRFLGLLKNTFESTGAKEICHTDFPTIRVYPDLNSYATPTKQELPAILFRSPFAEFTSRTLQQKHEQRPTPGWAHLPFMETDLSRNFARIRRKTVGKQAA